MTVAPIAIVAALRETSVLFGAAIAVVFLKEPLRASRVVAALMIVAGLALIRLSLSGRVDPFDRNEISLQPDRRAAVRDPPARPRPTA